MTSKLLQTALYLLALPFVWLFGLATFIVCAMVSTWTDFRKIWTK